MIRRRPGSFLYHSKCTAHVHMRLLSASSLSVCLFIGNDRHRRPPLQHWWGANQRSSCLAIQIHSDHLELYSCHSTRADLLMISWNAWQEKSGAQKHIECCNQHSSRHLHHDVAASFWASAWVIFKARPKIPAERSPSRTFNKLWSTLFSRLLLSFCLSDLQSSS